MGEEGDILYFDLFYFKNGASPKSKYFIVLKTTGPTAILASLPSSRDFRPATSYEVATLRDIYPVQDLDYKIVGRLKDAEFGLVKECFSRSASVKRRFRRLLATN